MAYINFRYSKNKNIVADRVVDGDSCEKVIARPGFRGVYRWTTGNTAAQTLARAFAKDKVFK